MLLGEVIDRHGRRRDIALKGSGRTPFSRGGDGKAAVGPVLREYLIGEAMHALGIPTTRALAAVRSGEVVWRDQPLPGALLTRVAASHVRVGTFQFFAARGAHDTVRALAEYVIARHDPDLAADPDRYLGLLRRVASRQAALVAQWMLVGFIHGVMNTDNMTVSGETIDYGPCAFLEAYDPRTVFSSIDTHGRYAYGNQPLIARWNLARFAETLLPLIDSTSTEQAVARATEVIDAFPGQYASCWLAGVRAKLGLAGRRRRRRGARRRLAGAAGGARGRLHAGMAAARRRRRRRRAPARRAVRGPGGARGLARAMAPARRAGTAFRRRAAGRHASRQPAVHSAQSPRRGSARRRLRARRPGAVRAAARGDHPPIRRAPRLGSATPSPRRARSRRATRPSAAPDAVVSAIATVCVLP